MKKFKLTHSVAAKTVAYILLAAMAMGLFLSGAGLMFAAAKNIYTGELEEIKESVFRDLWAREAWSAYLAYDRGDQVVDYSENIRYEIYSGGDELLWKSSREAAEEEYSFTIWCGEHEGGGYYYDYYGDAGNNSDDSIISYINADFPQSDELAMANRLMELIYSWRFVIIAVFVLCLLGITGLFVFLLCAAGHRAGHEEIVPGLLTKVPLDLLLAALISAAAIILAAVVEGIYLGNDVAQLILVGCGVIASGMLCVAFLCDFAIRVKLGKWWRCSLIYMALALLRKFCRSLMKGMNYVFIDKLPFIWKSAALFGGVCIIEIFFLLMSDGDTEVYVVFWFIEHVLLLGAAIYVTLALQRLQRGAKALAAGELSAQVSTEHLVWDFKGHAEDLNSIGLGMSRAVDERLKSERLKTELITNVSHDIKTPLTSIINYSDLICREEQGSEKIAEYARVLHRQSERLKKLIEDLTEASKASTGSIEVFLAPCEGGVLLEQAAGEYEQRLKDCGLELIVKQPEEAVRIMADGRHIWRVFDNLMNNVCKYAQPGTRVYLSLEKKQGKAVFSIKNTSRYALDISADELMERFARGDSSRSTEGSGLGLSIARSLTQLQKGELELTVDGDLFKVCLSFDAVE